MVLTVLANSEGSGETAYPCSLATAFAVCTQRTEVDKGSDRKRDVLPHWMAANARLKI